MAFISAATSVQEVNRQGSSEISIQPSCYTNVLSKKKIMKTELKTPIYPNIRATFSLTMHSFLGEKNRTEKDYESSP